MLAIIVYYQTLLFLIGEKSILLQVSFSSHIFTCLRVICIFSSMKYLLISFDHFYIGLLIYFFLIWGVPFIKLDKLALILVELHISHPGSHLHLLMMLLSWRDSLIFTKSHLAIISSKAVGFCGRLRKSFPILKS